ncbi:MAG: hypothetical protein H0V50_07850, partial [Thermoleophilaceae bacterium]|nr:hypothetical protein [Thermoleophilaceae bacterium]
MGVVLTRAEVDRTDDTLRKHFAQLLTAYASTRPIRRIAVIGNAPLEPSRRRAAQIDGSDL